MTPLFGHRSRGLFEDRAGRLDIVAPHEQLEADTGPGHRPIHLAAGVRPDDRVDAGRVERADRDIGLLPVAEGVNDDEVGLAHARILRPCRTDGAIIRPLSPDRSLKDLEGDAMKKCRNVAWAL